MNNTYFYYQNIQYNKKVNYFSSTKVGLCLISKKENLYIKEFIEHYRNLGYNHIFLYDNNEIDDERFEEVINDEIQNGFVSIINFRGKHKQPQFKVYIDCYEKNSKNYDWLSFFDSDEFLELKPKNIKIQQFLDNKRYNYCQNIKINWVLYTDNNKLSYENIQIQKRFTEALFNNSLNIHIKSTIRGNLSTNYWIGAINPHSGRNKYNCCSSSGNQISKNSPFNKPYDYKYAYLKHYMTKTIEEYIIKIKKGRAASKRINLKLMYNNFFNINKKTTEKLSIFKKAFN